jgi:hypothetical protein
VGEREEGGELTSADERRRSGGTWLRRRRGGETRCAASAASVHTATTAALRRRRGRRERGRGEEKRWWARNCAGIVGNSILETSWARKLRKNRLGKMYSARWLSDARALAGQRASSTRWARSRARYARLLSRERDLGWGRGCWAARHARAGLPRLGLACAAATRGVELGWRGVALGRAAVVRARGGGGGGWRGGAANWAATRWAEWGEGREGTGAAGPAELGQGGDWATFPFSFLFLFSFSFLFISV